VNISIASDILHRTHRSLWICWSLRSEIVCMVNEGSNIIHSYIDDGL